MKRFLVSLLTCVLALASINSAVAMEENMPPNVNINKKSISLALTQEDTQNNNSTKDIHTIDIKLRPDLNPFFKPEMLSLIDTYSERDVTITHSSAYPPAQESLHLLIKKQMNLLQSMKKTIEEYERLMTLWTTAVENVDFNTCLLSPMMVVDNQEFRIANELYVIGKENGYNDIFSIPKDPKSVELTREKAPHFFTLVDQHIKPLKIEKPIRYILGDRMSMGHIEETEETLNFHLGIFLYRNLTSKEVATMLRLMLTEYAPHRNALKSSLLQLTKLCHATEHERCLLAIIDNDVATIMEITKTAENAYSLLTALIKYKINYNRLPSLYKQSIDICMDPLRMDESLPSLMAIVWAAIKEHFIKKNAPHMVVISFNPLVQYIEEFLNTKNYNNLQELFDDPADQEIVMSEKHKIALGVNTKFKERQLQKLEALNEEYALDIPIEKYKNLATSWTQSLQTFNYQNPACCIYNGLKKDFSEVLNKEYELDIPIEKYKNLATSWTQSLQTFNHQNRVCCIYNGLKEDFSIAYELNQIDFKNHNLKTVNFDDTFDTVVLEAQTTPNLHALIKKLAQVLNIDVPVLLFTNGASFFGRTAAVKNGEHINNVDGPIIIAIDKKLLILSDDEMEFVLAHEMIHIKNHHIYHYLKHKKVIQEKDTSEKLSNFFHRMREREADTEALYLTSKPAAMISTLLKLSSDPKNMSHPTPHERICFALSQLK